MSSKVLQSIYQFHITLEGTTPPIYRVIELPQKSSFWELHCAIQDAFGWEDMHLHEFNSIPQKGKLTLLQRIGIPINDPYIPKNEQPKADWSVKLESAFKVKGDLMSYIYDFGDNWEHTVRLASIYEAEPLAKYPRCIDGKRACPPEDCGGVRGYESLLKILQNTNDPEYSDMMQWFEDISGQKVFDPELFEANTIKFTHAQKRLKELKKELK